ncbi:restriction endonuclease PLD domain-containing protein [Staphylococcus hyicus]|uniref:restriction endonuclease PLD domain-containing protein n=1 Tax=Staphylococcus hyicus TaxID=1284 RepID=UPI002738396B|nr:restriction endonuclease PLD domain-containing protein [Staphylococcus hyicus]MDP4469172.1 NgoFVII family restriction endonuclease [Staphylococcus hyicus]
MLYYTGLEEIIFNKHLILPEEPDELIIISGFLGPAPVDRVSKFEDLNITIVGGMYSNGIDLRLLNSLNRSLKKNNRLNLYFSSKEIHSKIYIWKKGGKTLGALIGSANFSSNGLRTDYRESLADATRDTFSELDRYVDFIIKNSTKTPVTNKKQQRIEYVSKDANLIKSSDFKITAEIPLYDSKSLDVPLYSGLNWGRSRLNGSHTAEGDAYIRIPKSIIIENEGLILPFDPTFITPQGKRKRNSNPIEIIWDDGYIMEASLEGIQKYKGAQYPKQIASYSSKIPMLNGKKISKKSILGRYLRRRLGIDIDDVINKDLLNNYGRDTITLSLIEEGIYYADFSVK